MWWGRKLAKEQLNTTRTWDLCTSASAMSVTDLEAAANCLKIFLTTSLLSFILVLKAHSIGMDVILGLHHHKALACGVLEYLTYCNILTSIFF